MEGVIFRILYSLRVLEKYWISEEKNNLKLQYFLPPGTLKKNMIYALFKGMAGKPPFPQPE